MDFKVGDVVMIKSGGPRMTVTDLMTAPGRVTTCWFGGNTGVEVITSVFNSDELMAVNLVHPLVIFADPCVALLEDMILGRSHPPEAVRKLVLAYRNAQQITPTDGNVDDESLTPMAAAIRNTMWLYRGDLAGYIPWINVDPQEQKMWRQIATSVRALAPR